MHFLVCSLAVSISLGVTNRTCEGFNAIKTSKGSWDLEIPMRKFLCIAIPDNPKLMAKVKGDKVLICSSFAIDNKDGCVYKDADFKVICNGRNRK